MGTAESLSMWVLMVPECAVPSPPRAALGQQQSGVRRVRGKSPAPSLFVEGMVWPISQSPLGLVLQIPRCDLIHILPTMLSASPPPSHPPPPLAALPGITSKQTACVYVSASGKAHIRQPGVLCIRFTFVSIPSHSHSANSSVTALPLLLLLCARRGP